MSPYLNSSSLLLLILGFLHSQVETEILLGISKDILDDQTGIKIGDTFIGVANLCTQGVFWLSPNRWNQRFERYALVV